MFTTRRLIIGLLLLALAVGTPLALTAGPADALTKAEVRAKLKAARAKIVGANKRKEKIGDQIAALDKRLTAIDDELVLLGGQITTVRTKLTVTQEKLDILQEQLRLKRLELRAAEEKLAFEQENLEMRVVAAYKTSDLTYVDVVLASTSFEDLVSRTSIVQRPHRRQQRPGRRSGRVARRGRAREEGDRRERGRRPHRGDRSAAAER